MSSSNSRLPLSLPPELQHLIEKRESQRRSSERRAGGCDSEMSHEEGSVAGDERRQGEERRQSDRRTDGDTPGR